MPEVVFPLDSTKKFTDQKLVGHNRWHPDIPAAVQRQARRRRSASTAVSGSTAPSTTTTPPTTSATRRCRRCTCSAARSRVEGAEPGDLLVVDILDVGPIPQEDSGPLAGQGWGYTGVFATQNGGGFLTEQFPDAYKVIWDFTRRRATSRHVPGCLVHRHRPPGPDGHRAVGRAAGEVERAREAT